MTRFVFFAYAAPKGSVTERRHKQEKHPFSRSYKHYARNYGMISASLIIDVAMKYCDKTQFGRDRTPGDPQRFHNVNSLVWRCGAAGVRALPVLTAHNISLPEQ